MEMASSMKDLTDNIFTSYNVRVKALGDLVSDTRKTLSDFAEKRKSMGREQNGYLSDFTNGLSAGVGDMLKGFCKNRKTMGDEQAKHLEDFANGLMKKTSDMLNRFSKDHRRISDEQAKNLADFVNNLTRDVSAMMNGFRKTRGEMSAELKNKLADDLKNIRTYTGNTLKEFEKSHSQMSDSLKKSLARYANDLAKGVSRLLHGYKADMKEAGKSWGKMSSTLSGLRKVGMITSTEARERVSTVQEAVEKGPRQKKTISDTEVEIRVLNYINKHPEGAKVGNMEISLGVPRLKLGVKAKKLLEEGRVRKEANVYYPLKTFRVSSRRSSRKTH